MPAYIVNDFRVVVRKTRCRIWLCLRPVGAVLPLRSTSLPIWAVVNKSTARCSVARCRVAVYEVASEPFVAWLEANSFSKCRSRAGPRCSGLEAGVSQAGLRAYRLGPRGLVCRAEPQTT